MKGTLFLLFYFATLASFCQTPYLKYRIKDQTKSNKTIGTEIRSILKTIENNPVTFQNYKGKFIVVDFWFTKCQPCFREFPYMDSIKHLFKEFNLLSFINICSESNFYEWQTVIKDRHITGINLFDDNIKYYERRIIGSPKSSGLGIIHDQLFLLAYPGYAFIDSSGKILGATTVAPSDKLLFAYYIEGVLKSRSLEESLRLFITEIKSEKLSDDFLLFIQSRFSLTVSEAYKLVAPYKKLL